MSSDWDWPEPGAPGTCRQMETRRCPPDGCFELPCARFEVTEEDEAEVAERWGFWPGTQPNGPLDA